MKAGNTDHFEQACNAQAAVDKRPSTFRLWRGLNHSGLNDRTLIRSACRE